MPHLMRCISGCPTSCHEQHETSNTTGTKTGASPAPFGGRETALRGKRIDESRKQREDRYQPPLGQVHLSRSKICPKNRSHPSDYSALAIPGESIMLNTLYSHPAVIARHRAAPLSGERERFLRLCADRGHNLMSLRKIAWLLLVIVTSVPLGKGIVEISAIRRAARVHKLRFKRGPRGRRCASSQQIFVATAKRFFQFLGRFASPTLRPCPLESHVRAYRRFLLEERGLSTVTAEAHYQQARHFLLSFRPNLRSLRTITINQVDRYLVFQNHHGWSRRSMATLASSLRCFLRFGEARRWCRPGVAAAINSPRMYMHEGVPRSASWDQVEALIASTSGNTPTQIRDLAIVLLLAVYGLRRGEVSGLRLDDVDWEAETVRICRSKQRRIQQFPLVRRVGDAIVRYLREVRPRCTHRELFLALKPPVRPLSAESISHVAHWRLRAVGVTLPRVGAHCLRHACARQLLARGFSLKEIGDQLGHRRVSATLLYTKVDLEGLRQVADLDLGRLV